MRDDVIILFDIDYTLFDTDTFKKSSLTEHKVYNEVEQVLSDLSQKAIFGIFSEGQKEFQEAKLLKTNIDSHFPKEHVHIFEKKDISLQEVIEKYVTKKKIVLVDDKLSILCFAKKLNSEIFTIWVKRGIYAESQQPIEGCQPDATVFTLDEIQKYL